MLARVWRVLINVCVRASARVASVYESCVCERGIGSVCKCVCVCVFRAVLVGALGQDDLYHVWFGQPHLKFVQGLVGGLLGLLGRQMAEADSGLSLWVELRLRYAIRERSSEFHY